MQVGAGLRCKSWEHHHFGPAPQEVALKLLGILWGQHLWMGREDEELGGQEGAEIQSQQKSQLTLWGDLKMG